MKRYLFIVCLLCLGLPVSGQQMPANPREGCVAEYDPAIDYFPQKTTVDYATGFAVDYFGSYKLVRVISPFPGAAVEDGLTYALVQCGTPVPADLPPDTRIIEVPVDRVITMSTTFLPHLVALDVLESLVGVDSLLYTNTPEVLALGEAGALVEVGFGSSISMETVIAAEPDVVIANASGSPEYDAAPVLEDAGIPVVISADYVEQSPLGRAEWLKFTALFYNEEAAANEVFEGIATRYEELRRFVRTSAAPPRYDRVLWGSFSSYSSAWYIPGDRTYVAQLLRDAGMGYVLDHAPEAQGFAGSFPVDFETAYDAGLDAPLWIPDWFGVNSLADLLAQDERYADFAALQNGDVFTAGARVNANGGNDYFESGALYADRVLADLVEINFGGVLTDGGLTYFKKLD
jgi:iron complex transport system substrate-binding protein